MFAQQKDIGQRNFVSLASISFMIYFGKIFLFYIFITRINHHTHLIYALIIYFNKVEPRSSIAS